MSAPLWIGVDVGGTKVSVAALDSDRGLGEPLIRPTTLTSGDELLEQLVAQVKEVAGAASIAAVGIGIPSVVDFETGRVRSSVNIPLHDVPLRAVLADRLGVPVFVDNDATVAAFAEAHDDSNRIDVRNLVMVTVGTGVGGGIVIDGRVYRGATGAAGELGMTLLAIDPAIPAPTRFPQPGSFESLAAGHVLDQLAAQAAAAHPDSPLGRLQNPLGPDVVREALGGDAVATETLATLGHRLGAGIANVINIFDPDVVAVGGGVSAAGELLLGPARETALGYVVPGAGTKTTIRIARSGPQAGVRGAALLALSELNAQTITRAGEMTTP
jgi:glucokinase